MFLHCLCGGPALAANAIPVSIEQGWSYHWGEVQRTADGRGWDLDSAEWRATVSPAAVPGRDQQQILWLKLQLPSGAWRDPYLFISSIDLSAQIFDSRGQLYQFGEFDAEGRSRFAGWPWHLIEVPNADLGQTLYFRVFSDYADIGLAGQVLLGERADLLQRVYARGFTGIAFALVVFIVGFISMCLGLIKRDHGVAMATGMLSFDLALMMFAENELSQVAYNAPLMWRYIAAYSYFIVPALLVGVARMVQKIAACQRLSSGRRNPVVCVGRSGAVGNDRIQFRQCLSTIRCTVRCVSSVAASG